MVKKKSTIQDFRKIGETITKLMEACGIDAAQLSMQTGLPPSTISRLRSNTTDFSPNLSSLLPIANFFRITISQLIGEETIDSKLYGTFKPTRMTKLPLPILDRDSIHHFLSSSANQHLQTIDVDIPVSAHSFVYVLQGNAMEPHFPDKTLLIVDPEVAYENLDHLLVIPKDKRTPILRQVMMDGDEKYLRALNVSFNEFTKFDDNTHSLLGVMVQSRFNFKTIKNTSQQDSGLKNYK